jgi:hypothetical protein
MRASATFLTLEQLREAESAFRRLADLPLSLTAYLDFALACHRVPERQQTLAGATTEHTAARQKDVERTLLPFRQIRSIVNELDHFRG